MATTIVNTPGFHITIQNRTNQIIHTAGVKLGSGESRTIPAKYLIDSYNLADDLGRFVELGTVTAHLTDTDLGYVNLPLSGSYLRFLTTPMPLPYSVTLTLDVAVMPAVGDVPEGFTVLEDNAGTYTLRVKMGGAWRSTTLT